MLFVNIYSVGRSYGGPEEGGWYFDTWQPVGSIPVDWEEDEWEEMREGAVRAGILTSDYDRVPFDTEEHTHSSWCRPTESDIQYEGCEIPSISVRCYENDWREFSHSVLYAKANKVRDEWRDKYPTTGKRGSVLGGDDYDIRIEGEFATAGDNYQRWE